jgi:hypothetical protein
MSTRGHWDCTTLQHHCTTCGFASGYTEVLQGGTISMSTDRHVDNLYYPRLDKHVGFWSQHNLMHCLFFLHLLRCLIFFLKKYILRSPFWMKSALRLFTFYTIFTSCIATQRPPVTLRNYQYDYVIKRTRKSIKNQFLFSNRG